MTIIARDLLYGVLVLGALGFLVRGARPPPSLGRAGPLVACPVPVEIAGQGVACWSREQAAAAHVRAGARLEPGGRSGTMAPDRLAAWQIAIDVNRASAEELASLDGIGPKLAARIIAARPFASVDDLARVPGIGRHRLDKLRDRLQLDEGARDPL